MIMNLAMAAGGGAAAACRLTKQAGRALRAQREACEPSPVARGASRACGACRTTRGLKSGRETFGGAKGGRGQRVTKALAQPGGRIAAE